MKKTNPYTSPQCEMLEMNTEYVIATSIAQDFTVDNPFDGSEEEW